MAELFGNQKIAIDMVEELDCVAIRIDEKLGSLSPLSSNHCIFKVPNPLRMVNEKAYEPEIIAIGPYHRGKDQLKAIEEHKIRYLQMFLQRIHQNSSSGIVQAMRELEERARSCYTEPVCLTKDEFVEMMVYDGCFIIEFLCCHIIERADPHDPILEKSQFSSRVMMDLLLVENQLPFFVLMELFGKIIWKINLIKLILAVFKLFLPGQGYDPQHEYTSVNIIEIKHLLQLIHDNWQPLPPRMDFYLSNMKIEQPDKISLPRCAVELHEAGIKFKKVEGQNLFDISFTNGTIGIPTLDIADDTERVMRNLIAYEQLNPDSSPSYVTEYMVFMDCLINSGKDVQILCRHGIIKNRLGDDERVATLFNNIGQNVVCDRVLYADIQNSLNEHCNKRWNVWMATLRRDYFKNPWALISVLAAIFLLSLTIAQTVYSALSYHGK